MQTNIKSTLMQKLWKKIFMASVVRELVNMASRSRCAPHALGWSVGNPSQQQTSTSVIGLLFAHVAEAVRAQVRKPAQIWLYSVVPFSTLA